MPHAFKPIFVMIKILITFFFDNFEVVHTFTNRFGKVGAIIISKQEKITSLIKLSYNSKPNWTSWTLM